MTYASSGQIIDRNKEKVFKLFNGSVINKKENKINVFEFDQIDINLSEYSTNTILVPKLQETSNQKLFNCSLNSFLKDPKPINVVEKKLCQK